MGMSVVLDGRDAQKDFGSEWVRGLPHGTLVFLEGDLGSGKTTLVQGMLSGLGFSDEVTSPTYALMHPYPTVHGTVLHIDAYRIKHPDELWDMDLEELVETSVLTLFEWGEMFYSDFPDALRLCLEHHEGGRRITRLN